MFAAEAIYSLESLPLFTFTALCLILSIVFWIRYKPQTNKSNSAFKMPVRWNEPPADKHLGDLTEMSKAGNIHDYLVKLHDHGHVPVTSFWWGSQKVVSVCSPRGFKNTLKLTNRANNLLSAIVPLVGSDSIEFAKGEDWESRRKYFYPVFKGENLESYFPHFVSIAEEMKNTWSNLKPDESIPLTKTMFAMTIKGITCTIFGESFEDPDLVENIATANMKAWEEIEIRARQGEDPKQGSERDLEFKKSTEYMKGVVKDVICRRKEGLSKDHIPFIDTLLQSGVPEEQAISDALSFMIGGFHSSGNFMVWLLWYLASNPDIQDKLREELRRETRGDVGDRLKKYALSVSTGYGTYFRQIQDETLRIGMLTTWMVKESPEDIIVDGHMIPAGTPIIQALGVAMQNATTWTEGNPDKFQPERFAPNSPHARRGMEFCPFSVPSRRMCPGYMFSHFETTVFLSILLYRFELSPVPGQVMEQEKGMVTRPRNELFVTIKMIP